MTPGPSPEASGSCPTCGSRPGTGPDCPSCQQSATRALAEVAVGVTPANVESSVRRLGRYLRRLPWWTRGAPEDLVARLRLVRMVLFDTVRRRHWLPWRAITVLAAAGIYVISPADLVLDYLGPLGFADDLLVMRIAWRAMNRPLLDYCLAKGISPERFGLGGDR